MQEPASKGELPERSEVLSSGCFFPLIGGVWVLAIFFTVPISADNYEAPGWVKLVVTFGHFAAIAMMLYPSPRKGVASWIVEVAVSLWAAMEVMVLWYWN